jgi:GAF domain
MSRRQGDDLLDKIRKWLDELGGLLLPPFAELKDDRLLQLVCRELAVDAAALYLVNENDSNQLRFVSGHGYREDYVGQPYNLDQPALTSHVFRSGQAINMSADDLAPRRGRTGSAEAGRLPFTGRCEKYIKTGVFKNIIAIPLVFEANPLGVLKVENKKGTTSKDPFPQGDFQLATILARTITILVQQRITTRLWTEGEVAMANAQTLDQYLSWVVQILKRIFNAECCSIFLQGTGEGNHPILKYRVGDGYKPSYSEHPYHLPQGEECATSLTAHVAASRTCVCESKEVLQGGDYPYYSGTCSRYILSGTFRNILAVPLVESEDGFGRRGAPCYGVLKIENRRPDFAKFGQHDVEVCKAFVTRQVVPTLKKLSASPQVVGVTGRVRRRSANGSGVAALRSHFKNLPGDTKGLRQRFVEVIRFRTTRPDEITFKDCMEYMGLAHATFHRWKQKLEDGKLPND